MCRSCHYNYMFTVRTNHSLLGSKNATGTPRPGQPTTSVLWNCFDQSSRYSTLSYFWTSLATSAKLVLVGEGNGSRGSRAVYLQTYAISVMAKFWPMQILGPPLKGTYCQGFGVQLYQRSGLKMAGSAKVSDTAGYRSLRLCMARVL